MHVYIFTTTATILDDFTYWAKLKFLDMQDRVIEDQKLFLAILDGQAKLAINKGVVD